jgi:hypothetical protein
VHFQKKNTVILISIKFFLLLRLYSDYKKCCFFFLYFNRRRFLKEQNSLTSSVCLCLIFPIIDYEKRECVCVYSVDHRIAHIRSFSLQLVFLLARVEPSSLCIYINILKKLYININATAHTTHIV